jgi:hypothetical protein
LLEAHCGNRMAANRHSGHGGKHNVRLSQGATEVLTAWIEANQAHPYPTDSDKATLQAETSLSHRQINNWFANARRRRHRPMASETQQAAHGVLYATCDNRRSLQSTHLVSTKIYQCTFCTLSLATKYDWTRHELSVHLPLKRYICSPFTPITTNTATNEDICAYCDQTDTTAEHITLHNHVSCQNRLPEARIFYRKDHLKQHLQSMDVIFHHVWKKNGCSKLYTSIPDAAFVERASLYGVSAMSTLPRTIGKDDGWTNGEDVVDLTAT